MQKIIAVILGLLLATPFAEAASVAGKGRINLEQLTGKSNQVIIRTNIAAVTPDRIVIHAKRVEAGGGISVSSSGGGRGGSRSSATKQPQPIQPTAEVTKPLAGPGNSSIPSFYIPPTNLKSKIAKLFQKITIPSAIVAEPLRPAAPPQAQRTPQAQIDKIGQNMVQLEKKEANIKNTTEPSHMTAGGRSDLLDWLLLLFLLLLIKYTYQKIKHLTQNKHG